MLTSCHLKAYQPGQSKHIPEGWPQWIHLISAKPLLGISQSLDSREIWPPQRQRYPTIVGLDAIREAEAVPVSATSPKCKGYSARLESKRLR